MNILLMLIPVSLLLLLATITAFLWALRRGQFEDLESAALDLLVRDPMEVRLRPALQPAAAPVPKAAHETEADASH